jgi:tetratricopeptide (TPR) repeat protein
LNVRLLSGLAMGLLVLGIGSYSLHAYQMQRHASAYLREARRAQEENRPQEALRHFRRYVKLAPHDTEGLALYGLQLAELDQLEPAYLALDQALRREPDREEWRRQLVETAIELKRYTDARAHLEDHLLQRFPEDAALWTQLGRCHVALGQDDRAAEAFETAIAASPQHLEAYILLAGLHDTRFKDTAEADRWIDRMVAANESDFEAYLIRGEWRLDRQRVQGAKPGDETMFPVANHAAAPSLAAAQQDAQRALELAPNEMRALLFAARIAASHAEWNEARTLAARARDTSPQSPQPYALLAEIEAGAGELGSAIDWLRRGIDAAPYDAHLHWDLARLLVEVGRLAEAHEQIKQLRRERYPDARLRHLEAKILMAEENWLAAAQLLEANRIELAQWGALTRQADLWLGNCYEQLGYHDQQLAAYRRAVANDPADLSARLGLAAALLATGRTQEAQEHYRYVSSRPEAPPAATLRLIQLEIASMGRRTPSQRDWTAIERQLDALEQAIPAVPEVALVRAELRLAQGKPDDARRVLDDARRQNPGQIDIVAAQIALAEQSNNESHFDELLADAEADIDDPVAFALLKGQTILRRAGSDAAPALEELWQTSERLSPADRTRLAEGLSSLAARSEAFELAADLAAMVAEARPNDLRIRQHGIDIAVRGRQWDRLEAILADVRKIEGEGPLWHYGRALQRLANAQGSDDLAVAFDDASKARVLRPGWSKAVLLLAEILDRQGDAARAADAYLEAMALGERQPRLIARAVTRLFEQRRFADADQVLRRAQEHQGHATSDLTRLAAEVSLQLQDFDRALDLARTVAADSHRLEDHLWAAHLFELVGQTEEAETRLRRAIELNSAAPEPRVALVQLLARSGRSHDAETAVADAQSAIPAEQAAVTIAQCYQILGRPEAAAQQYQRALATSPEDALIVRRAAEFYLANRMSSEAEPLLRRLVEGEIESSEHDRAWARTSLALVLGTSGDPRGTNEALKLLDANRGSPHATSADLRARAVILASQPSADARKQAIETLQQLLADDRATLPEDRFLLAELLRQAGDSSRAGEQLRRALAAQPEEHRYVSAYVRLLLERGETAEAELWIDRLKALAPHHRQSVEWEARLQIALGRPTEAATVLIDFANSPDDSQGASAQRLWAIDTLATFAAELDAAGKHDDARLLAERAVPLVTRHLQEQPEEVLRVAVSQARFGQIDEALAALAGAPDTATTESIEALAVAIMTNPVANDAHLSQLQHLLDRCLERDGAPTPLLAISADLLGWRGDFAGAQARYRLLLERNRADVRALNNLALVLALGEHRHDEALALIERAIELAGPHGALLDTRGLIHLAAGRAKTAQEDFQRAIEQNSAVERYLHLAGAQWKAQEETLAKQSWSKAKSLGFSWNSLHPLERELLADLRTRFQ